VTLASTSATGSVAVNGTVTDPNAPAPQSDLIITGIIDAPRTGGLPKAIEIYVVNSVADLSIYKVQSYANGGTTPSTPLALTGSATAGQYLYVASESSEFTAYFGFAPTATGSALNVNGNDVVALTKNDALVDVFGTIGVDPAVDTAFNYLDTWFYRKSSTGPSPTFNLADWTFPTVQSDALDSLGTTGVNPAVGNALRMPIGTFTFGSGRTGPTITSTNAFSGTVGVAFSNTITATGSAPIAFSGTNLPRGLSVATNGVISGTPTAAGTFTNAVLTATNAAGTNNQVATFTIAKGAQATVLGSLGSATISVGGTTTVTASRGTGTGAYDFRQNGGTGSVSFEGTGDTRTIIATTAGSPVIEVRRLADADYNDSSWFSAGALTVNPAPVGTTYNSWLGIDIPSDAAFLDYVFGAATPGTLDPSLKPTVAIVPPAGGAGGDTATLVLTYHVRQNTVGLTVTPKTSADLAAGPSGWVMTDVIVANVGDPREVNGVSVQQKTASVPVSGTKKFLRVEAVQQ
jgi:hypothetical protein